LPDVTQAEEDRGKASSTPASKSVAERLEEEVMSIPVYVQFFCELALGT